MTQESIPFLDLDRALEPIREDVESAALRVLRSGQFILGEEVRALEAEFGEFLGGAQVVGVSSGTAALFVAMMALEIGPGDEVITTPFTFASPVEAICRLGARPVFVDVDADGLLDLDQAEASISKSTKAILPVHLFGKCVDLRRLREICDAHEISLIEDAAQAHGAKSAGLTAGTTGEFGCFSFYPTKNLGAAGDAGAVVTTDAELADRARLISRHGARPKYHHQVLGQNERLDAIQAAILRVKLPHLGAWNDARRGIAAAYRERLDGVVELPTDDPGHVYHHFVVRVPDRGIVRERLAEDGIGNGVYYPSPLHLQPAFQPFLQGELSLPMAEQLSRDALALPIFPGLTKPEIDRICQSIRLAVGAR